MRILSIALNTFRENLREKLLYNLLFFALLMIGSSILLSRITLGDYHRLILDLGLASINLFGVLIAIFVGIGLVSKEVDRKTIYTIVSKPIPRYEFLLGKMIFNIALAILQAAITVGLGAALLGVTLRTDLLPLLLFGVAAGTAGWVCFFSIFALRIRRNDLFNSVMSVFYFVFLFASSIFYPLEPLPAWFQWTAILNPLTWQVDLMRYSSIGVGDPWQVFVESLAFVVFSLGAFAYAVRCLQQQD